MKTMLLPAILFLAAAAPALAQTTYLGRLSANPYAPDSTSNAFGRFGSEFSPTSIKNPYSPWGSATSPVSAANPYATSAPRIVAADGTSLGRLSANPYAPDSTSNPYGPYGSPYSPTSINNPYGRYGSPFSPLSPTNPTTTQAPVLLGR